MCPYASQFMVFGKERNYVVALVTLDPDAMAGWAEAERHERQVLHRDRAVGRRPRDGQRLHRRAQRHLNRWETIKKWKLLDHDLTVESGELTPSMKVKRNVVQDNHKELIDEDVRLTLDERGPWCTAPAVAWLDYACPPLSLTATSRPRTACSPTRPGRSSARKPFGLYVHVPFCSVRCGYCDFNTYTAEELGDEVGASRSSYAEAAIREIRFARHVLGHRDVKIETIFFGGGTPTLLKPADLGAIVASAAAEFGLADDVEITTEANPDSVTAWDLEELRTAGFNRISFGMQSAVDHVLRTLDRTHDPMRVPAAVDWARQAGFDDVSLDLIYGTPGESLADWETSVESALCVRARPRLGLLPDRRGGHRAGPAGQARGELPMPDEDDLADKYHLADERFAKAGLGWYEVSNWATSPDHWCRHNLALLDRRALVGRRARRALARRRRTLVERQAPLGLRRAAGPRRLPGGGPRGARLPRPEGRADPARDPPRRGAPGVRARGTGRSHVARLVQEGLVELGAERLVLTQRGRLLADAVVRDLVD